jgi:hypothetical protein
MTTATLDDLTSLTDDELDGVLVILFKRHRHETDTDRAITHRVIMSVIDEMARRNLAWRDALPPVA